jgi:threonine dehydrogenase-like Zn-dependent dehydrogenase
VKQVVQTLRTGEVRVEDVPPPRLRAGGALVATQTSLISQGTERTKIELGQKSLLGKARARPELARQVIEKARQDGVRETYQTVMQRLESPAPLGYSCCGRVAAAAHDCVGIEAGDFVACAGAGYANHAELNFVPRNLMAKVPDGVSADQAAYATLGAIAMRGVRQAEVGLGDCVLVLGLGLVGLIALQLARAAGGRVLGFDIDPAACELAARLGAEQTVYRRHLIRSMTDSFTEGVGVDSVIICASTSSDDPISLAAELCRDRARIAVVGAVGMNLPREPFYDKELELRWSRSYGPGRYDPAYEEHGHDYPIGFVRWTEQRQLAEFLRLLREGIVDVEALTTHRYPLERADDAYALVSGATAGETHPVGILLEYPGIGSPVATRIHVSGRRRDRRGQLRDARALAHARRRRAGSVRRRRHSGRRHSQASRRALRFRLRDQRRRGADRGSGSGCGRHRDATRLPLHVRRTSAARREDRVLREAARNHLAGPRRGGEGFSGELLPSDGRVQSPILASRIEGPKRPAARSSARDHVPRQPRRSSGDSLGA